MTIRWTVRAADRISRRLTEGLFYNRVMDSISIRHIEIYLIVIRRDFHNQVMLSIPLLMLTYCELPHMRIKKPALFHLLI